MNFLKLQAKYYPDSSATVSGKVIGGDDFSGLVKELGLGSEFIPIKSKGETQNYNIEVKGVSIPKETLDKMAEVMPNQVYALLSFAAADKSVALTMKKTPPRSNFEKP